MAIPADIQRENPGIGEWCILCAYLAGIIDGEGTVRCRAKYGLSITVYNTDEALIRWLLERVGGSVTHERRTCAAGCDIAHIHHRKPRMAWSVGGELAAVVLEHIAPLMIIKRRRAEDCLSAWRARPRAKTLRGERVLLELHARGWPVEKPSQHGEYRHYKDGCRCALCRAANALKERTRRAAA